MSLQKMAEDLLEGTHASRITIRLEDPDDPFYPVKAEALALGVRSIVKQTNPKIREAPTFKFLQDKLSILVQNDVYESPPAFPEIVDLFGVRAQMLAPIVREGRLVGAISVHYVDGPREWSETDIAALRDASGRVHRELEQTAWAR